MGGEQVLRGSSCPVGESSDSVVGARSRLRWQVVREDAVSQWRRDGGHCSRGHMIGSIAACLSRTGGMNSSERSPEGRSSQK